MYTFRLRPGLRYWTGAPVRATDVRRGLERAAQTSGVLAGYIGALPGACMPGRPRCDLRAAVVADDRTGTVTLHLTHPDPELLLALGLPAFAPAPPGGDITPGTGPYRVTRFVPGHTITSSAMVLRLGRRRRSRPATPIGSSSSGSQLS